MKEIFETLFAGLQLTEEQAYSSMMRLTCGNCSEAEIAAFLAVYNMRFLDTDEFRGFRKALLERCISVDLSDFDTIDIVGTGGDGKNTFNISTTSCFVLAGAGYKVAKHGNYGQSSISGSANALEHFGYKFTNNISTLRKQMDKAGICFLHAPLFHPAMKHVAPVRQSLKVSTLFNFIGPVINPSYPNKLLLGVSNMKVHYLYSKLLNNENKSFKVIHATDGYDEVSLTENAIVGSRNRIDVLEPRAFGLQHLSAKSLSGGASVTDAANILESVLQNTASTAQKDVVLANSALGIQCFKPNAELTDCVAEAKESIESGRAYKAFKELMS